MTHQKPQSHQASLSPLWIILLSALVFAAAYGIAHAATITYLNGNLYNVQSSNTWANHTTHWIVQHGGLTNRKVQTGHQTTSGAHVAIARGWGNAWWGPSGPAGYYGRPKCWRLQGPSPVGVYCKRVTA